MDPTLLQQLTMSMSGLTNSLKWLLTWPRNTVKYQPLATLPLPFYHLQQLVRSRSRRHFREYAIYVTLAILVIIGLASLLMNFGGLSAFRSSYFSSLFFHNKSTSHTYRSDGLLEVNPDGIHPIFELIKDAQWEWNEKLKRSSKTFEEAIIEYRRRYGRMPPKGFDRWWAYVQKHDVLLPDEYDTIYDSLEPFWGVSPTDLQRLQSDWLDMHSDSVMVFGKSQDDPKKLRILRDDTYAGKRPWHEARVMERLDWVNDVEIEEGNIVENMPDFTALISPLDEPAVVVNWELRERAVRAARAGVYLNLTNLPEPEGSGWLYTCSPDSTARKGGINLSDPSLAMSTLQDKSKSKETPKTLIYDHSAYMDPCLHPSHFVQHSQFLQFKTGPSLLNTLAPQFSSCASLAHLDLLLVPPESYLEDTMNIPWADKTEERLVWRGSNTGMGNKQDTLWRFGQRERLAHIGMANEIKEGEKVEVLKSPEYDYYYGNDVEEEESRLVPVGKPEKFDKLKLTTALLDIKFAGSPIQCDWQTCLEFKNEFEWADRMSVEEADHYKYVLDVDGNGWSSRFRRLMSSNSVVFKSTIYPEWYSDRIQPWVHYIPVSIDYSEIYDIMTFFRGKPSYPTSSVNGHDEMAQRIAEAAHAWVNTFSRKEDMTAYIYRVLLEYARLVSSDREAMTMHFASSMI